MYALPREQGILIIDTCFEDRLPGNPAVDEEEIDEFIEPTSTTQEDTMACYRASTVWRRAAPSSRWYSVSDEPEELIQEAVTGHEGLGSESPGHLSSEDGDPSDEQWKGRAVKRHGAVPGE
jgi:hypothetical protein